MKEFARRIIHEAIHRAPWSIRNAVLEACISKFGMDEISTRVMTRLGIVEIGADGDLGTIRSAWNDRHILLTYARTRSAETAIMREVGAFFGDDEGTYVDVGANIGLTTIPIARKPKVRCIVFEPDPTNFRFLTLNVDQNAPDHRVEFHQAAIFERRTTLRLALAEGNLGDHRLTMTSVLGRRSVEVPALPLDEMVPNLTGRLAVKVDTQGAEPFVVAGGRKVFSNAQLVAMEFCPYLMRQLGGDPGHVLEVLREFDQIALLPAGTDVAPEYMASGIALEQIKDKLKTARESDGDYVDVVARRA